MNQLLPSLLTFAICGVLWSFALSSVYGQVGTLDTLHLEAWDVTIKHISSQRVVGKPSIILLHDWGELDHETEQLGQLLAFQGHSVIIPILYPLNQSRGRTESQRQAWHNPQELEVMLQALCKHVLREGKGGGQGLVLVGLGWGAKQALLVSMQVPEVRATALFYVHEVLAPQRFARLRAPVYIFVGEQERNSAWFVDHMRKYMYANGKPFFAQIYPGVGRDFVTHAQGPTASPSQKQALADAVDQIVHMVEP